MQLKFSQAVSETLFLTALLPLAHARARVTVVGYTLNSAKDK